MATITLPYDINNGDALDADKVMSNLEEITTEYNSSVGGLPGAIVSTTETQTLTNKTVTALKGTVQSTAQVVTTDTDGATVTFDLSASNVHQVTLGGNRTLAISNGTVGQYFAIELIQDATGSRTVTWFSTIKWVGNTAPTLTTTASKKDTFMFRVTGTGTYDGYIVGMNI